jgi:hypothetical protein
LNEKSKNELSPVVHCSFSLDHIVNQLIDRADSVEILNNINSNTSNTELMTNKTNTSTSSDINNNLNNNEQTKKVNAEVDRESSSLSFDSPSSSPSSADAPPSLPSNLSKNVNTAQQQNKFYASITLPTLPVLVCNDMDDASEMSKSLYVNTDEQTNSQNAKNPQISPISEIFTSSTSENNQPKTNHYNQISNGKKSKGSIASSAKEKIKKPWYSVS